MRQLTIPLGVLATAFCLWMTAAFADEQLTLDELTERWGSNLDEATITSTQLEPGLHVARGAGGAVLVSIGADGVMIVDDQFAKTVGRLQDEIRRLGGGAVDIVLNTHGHFDHADGNPWLGARGATIIAHENARRQMMRPSRLEYGDVYYVQPPYPSEGLPVITFADGITLHFNGYRIEVRYFGRGHTDGDAVIHLQEPDVLHVGDLYSAGYPYLDPGNGGTLSGLIAICRSILDITSDESRIVSGHSPVATEAELTDYVVMLETVYARLRRLAAAGASLDAALAEQPTAEFDEARGDATLFLSHAWQTVVAEFENQR